MYYKNIVETIGNTPLVLCERLNQSLNLEAKIYAKVESFNPGGSVKDRIAYNMLNRALLDGDIDPSSTIIEATSGNTGIGLALVCASLQLRCILVMPETMTVERRKLIQAYGAELVLTPGPKGMRGALEKANQLYEEIENSFIPSQFENPNNPGTHMKTTGMEILEDLNNQVDILVAGIGTGGTISGVGEILKKRNPQVKVVGVEPKDSPAISQCKSGPHKIQGIGAGFVPLNYNPEVVDEIQTVTFEQAKLAAQLVARTEGILVGISSGAAMAIAIELAKDESNRDKNIVVILPDSGEKYLSTDLFD